MGFWKGRLGQGPAAPGTPRWGLGRRVKPGRRCRARGGRKPGSERPSGAPRGAETRAGLAGRERASAGWASGLPCRALESGGRLCLAELGAARGAAEVWESEKPRVPGKEKCAAEERDLLEKLVFLPLPADPPPRWWRRLENFFFEICSLLIVAGPRLPRLRAKVPARRWSSGA